ncbi:hypothetical protein [Nesterenkonia suensis]
MTDDTGLPEHLTGYYEGDLAAVQEAARARREWLEQQTRQAAQDGTYFRTPQEDG